MIDLDIRQDVNRAKLRWPSESDCDDDNHLGLNQSYIDLRGFSFSDVHDIIEIEKEFKNSLVKGGDYEDCLEVFFEEVDSRVAPELSGLDPGIASSVVALSALGCVPFTSCNGGEFGGTHPEKMPLVGFFVPLDHVPGLIGAARASHVGLVNDVAGMGALILFSARTPDLQTFSIHLTEKYG